MTATPASFTSYAQNFEDVMLWRVFRDLPTGRYIDIGANDPVANSVSCAFHEHGWRGVSVEPAPSFAQRLREVRPEDVVIEAAVSCDVGVTRLFLFDETGLTTGVEEIAQRHSREDGLKSKEVIVPSVSLQTVFGLSENEDVHWLKIDVEGMEADVLRSWGDHACRPWIVIVESTAPNLQVETFQEWEDELLGRDYQFAYFDNVNRFYVHKSRSDYASRFALPPNYHDRFQLAEASPFVQDLRRSLLVAGEEAAAARKDLEQVVATLHLEAETARQNAAASVTSERVRSEERDKAWRETRDALDAALRLQAETFVADVKRSYEEREEAHQALQAAQRSAEALEMKLRDHESRFEETRREADALRNELRQSLSDKQNLTGWLEGERARVQALKRSISWRVSAPVRWISIAARKSVRLALRSVGFGVRAFPPLRRAADKLLAGQPDLRNRIASAARAPTPTLETRIVAPPPEASTEVLATARRTETRDTRLVFDALSRAVRDRAA